MKIFSFICYIRGLLLSLWYMIETDGHFLKEVKPGIFECELCKYRTFSMAKIKELKEKQRRQTIKNFVWRPELDDLERH